MQLTIVLGLSSLIFPINVLSSVSVIFVISKLLSTQTSIIHITRTLEHFAQANNVIITYRYMYMQI